MKARCINCSNLLEWRNQRGNRLADYNCKCGGKYERVNFKTVSGENPVNPDATETNVFTGEKFHYVLENSKGNRFYTNETRSKCFEHE